jgi:hypothetical protein
LINLAEGQQRHDDIAFTVKLGLLLGVAEYRSINPAGLNREKPEFGWR